MSMHHPISRRPLPERKGRRLQAVGDAAAIGAMVLAFALVVVFWLLTVLLPLALMAAAIYWLVTH